MAIGIFAWNLALSNIRFSALCRANDNAQAPASGRNVCNTTQHQKQWRSCWRDCFVWLTTVKGRPRRGHGVYSEFRFMVFIFIAGQQAASSAHACINSPKPARGERTDEISHWREICERDIFNRLVRRDFLDYNTIAGAQVSRSPELWLVLISSRSSEQSSVWLDHRSNIRCTPVAAHVTQYCKPSRSSKLSQSPWKGQ